jgi:hypothetical protein
MGIEVIHTVGVGQDYSTLVAWSQAQARDLDAANQDAVAELVGEHNNGTTTIDFAADGWVTSGADNIIIRAAPGYEYSTSANCNGTIDNTKALARWGNVSGSCFKMHNSTNHHEFIDIQVHWYASVAGAERIFDIFAQANSSTTITVKRCLLYIDTYANQNCTGPFMYVKGTDCDTTINLWMTASVYHNSNANTFAIVQGHYAWLAEGFNYSGTHTARVYGCTIFSAEHSSGSTGLNCGLYFRQPTSPFPTIAPYIINTVHYSAAATTNTAAPLTYFDGRFAPTAPVTNLNNADGPGNESVTVVAADWEVMPGNSATTFDGGTLDLNIPETSNLYQAGHTTNVGPTLNGITPSGNNYSIGAFALEAATFLGSATSTFDTHFADGMLGVGQTSATAPTIGSGTGGVSLGGTINAVGQVFTNTKNGDLVGAQFLIARLDDAAPETLVAKLYATSGGAITGTALATSTPVDLVDCGALDGGAEGTVVFKFPTPYACAPLATYGITVEASDGTTSNDFSVRTTDVAGSTGRATNGPGEWVTSTTVETPVHLSFSDTAPYSSINQLIGAVIATKDTDAAIGEVRRSTD